MRSKKKSKKKRQVVTIPAQTSITLDSGTQLHKTWNTWLYQNPNRNLPLKDKDKILCSKFHNVSHIFFEKDVSVHATNSLAELKRAVQSVETRFKKYKKFDGCFVHLGNISIFVTRKARK